MDSVANTNQYISNKTLNVGVITPPNKLYTPILYSNKQATEDFNKINHDIYVSMKKSESINKKKTPTSVFVTLGTITATILSFPLIKKFRKR